MLALLKVQTRYFLRSQTIPLQKTSNNLQIFFHPANPTFGMYAKGTRMCHLTLLNNVICLTNVKLLQKHKIAQKQKIRNTAKGFLVFVDLFLETETT